MALINQDYMYCKQIRPSVGRAKKMLEWQFVMLRFSDAKMVFKISMSLISHKL